MTNSETPTKTVKLWCQGGEHHWERASQRGKRPFSCPEHMEAKVTDTRTDEEKAAARAEAAEKRAATMAGKREQEEKERETRERTELITLNESAPEVFASYDKALTKAIKTNADEDWRTVTNLQRRSLSVSARLKVLEARYGA